MHSVARRGFRFKPPRVGLEPEVRWVLSRALGPAEQAFSGPLPADLSLLGHAAEVFALQARIGGRTPPGLLEREAGRELAERLRNRTRGTAGAILMLERVCGEIAERARLLGLPLVFLKGVAMHLTGMTPVGQRPLCDIDVMAPSARVGELQESLVAAGLEPIDLVPGEHQLQGLVHRSGLMVEVHRVMRGVRLGGQGSATAEELLEAGLCSVAPGLPAGCHVPSREVLIAHLLAHGLAQHGLDPDSYPMTRMLTDAQDMGIDDARLDELLAGPYRWIERDVSVEEVAAVGSLVGRLRGGEDPAELANGDDAAGRLLRHVVAGALDQAYRESIHLAGLFDLVPAGGRWSRFAHLLASSVWLTRNQVDAIYGPSRSGLGYLGRRLWRPFDLAWRAGRYSAAWARYRLRGSR